MSGLDIVFLTKKTAADALLAIVSVRQGAEQETRCPRWNEIRHSLLNAFHRTVENDNYLNGVLGLFATSYLEQISLIDVHDQLFVCRNLTVKNTLPIQTDAQGEVTRPKDLKRLFSPNGSIPSLPKLSATRLAVSLFQIQ